MILKIGMSGKSVQEIQSRLKTLGFNPGRIDGVFGPMTRAAVVAFQKAATIAIDGVVGPQTWQALFGGADKMPAAKNRIFISYINSDSQLCMSISQALEAAGYIVWYYERDSIPGLSYLIQTSQAIERAHAVVLIISPQSIVSNQVTREVVRAHELGKPVIPLLHSLTHFEFQKRQPEWRQALGAATSLPIPPEGVSSIIPRILRGLSAQGILPQHSPSRISAEKQGIDNPPSSYAAAHEGLSLANVDEADVRARANYHLESAFSGDPLGLFVGETDSGSAKIDHNSYVVTSKPGAYPGFQMEKLPRLTEFILEARVTKCSGPDDSWFGFVFGEPYPRDFHELLINGGRGVKITKHRQGQWYELAQRAGLQPAVPGERTAICKVVRKGATFHLLVGGVHGLSVRDRDIPVGRIGMILGPGLQVAFSDLRLTGISLDRTLENAWSHVQNLEMREARRLFQYVVDHDASHKDAQRMLLETRPDYRESILIVVGYKMLPQIHEGILAGKLKSEIDRRGVPGEFRWSGSATDTGLLEEDIYLRCPVISLGGPMSNQITARIAAELPQDPSSTEDVHIHHDLKNGKRHVALWGSGALETARAVDLFISSGLLDRFLGLIWSGESPEQS